MRSLPALAFLLLLTLAFFACDERAEFLFGASADLSQIEIVTRVSTHLKTLQQPANEGR